MSALPAGSPSLRILTWNLWWTFGPWEERQQAIRAVLRTESPDVVCLQETIAGSDQVEDLAGHLGCHWALSSIESRPHQGMANAILSRWPILTSRSVVLPSGEGRPSVRTVLVCQLDTPWGRWPVATTHLEHSFDASSVRLEQVDVVADVVREERAACDGELPVLIGGDFNAVPDSDEIRRMTGRSAVRHPHLVFADVWELRGSGPGHTWSSANPYLHDANWPNRRIDYLFVTWPRPKPAGHPIAVWLAGTEPVNGVMPSDHFAVVADLRVPELQARHGVEQV